jgi:hypothetical protein
MVSALAFAIGAFAPGVSRVVRDGLMATVAAQDPVQQEPPDTGRGAGRGQTTPRPYNTVVTNAFRTDDGIFKVHR